MEYWRIAICHALWNTWVGIILGVIGVGVLYWWVPRWTFGWIAGGLVGLILFSLWMTVYNGLAYKRLRGELILAALEQL